MNISTKLITITTALSLASAVSHVSAFTWPLPGQTPGTGGGLFTVDGNRNLGFGTPNATPATNPPGQVFGRIFMIAGPDAPGLAINNTLSSTSYIWFAEENGGLSLWDVNAARVRLHVDSTGQVGIGDTAPIEEKLHVFGNIRADSFVGNISGALSAANVTSDVFGRLRGQGNFAFPASLAVSTSSQYGHPQTLSIYGGGYFSSNVGIGTAAPNYTLDVSGIVNAADFFVNGQPFSAGLWSENDLDIYYAAGRVGIGTTSPVYELDVVGTINANEIYKNGIPLSTGGPPPTEGFWSENS